MAFLLVFDEASDILSAILPGEEPVTILHVILPAADELVPIAPLVRALTLHAIIHKGPLESTAILPGEVALAVLLPVVVLAFVDGAIVPILLPCAVMLVIDPIPLIVCSIHVEIGTLTI